jgi:putative peptidoglycan lipid II flippase
MCNMMLPNQTVSEPPPPKLARSISLLSLGNVASRVLGLLRVSIIARYFGSTGEVSAFLIASNVPTQLYDFLIGGMLSAALVPVLSDYARQSRQEFAQVASKLLSIFALLLAVIVVGLEVTAPTVAWLLAGGFRSSNPALLQLTTTLIRLLAPAVWNFGMAGVLTALLYSLQRFSFPAIATAIYNLGLVIAAPTLAHWFGITSLAIGVLSGSLAQLLVMSWDLRRAGLSLRFQVDWRHPALWRILQLYLPIALGLIVALLQVSLDRRLASGVGAQSIAWMANATTLQQLPLGLISVAISLAALPRLSRLYAEQQENAYRRTLGRGVRMVLLLMAPAAVGLWLLGEPLTRLIFEHGKFTPLDTKEVVQALHVYVIGMIFAAVDFPLNYAFYARNNTLLPALVGIFSVVIYLITAFLLLRPLGYLGLVWADTAKQASHALCMIILLNWRVGRLRANVLDGLLRTLLAMAMMAAGMVMIERWLPPLGLTGRWQDLSTLAITGGAGMGIYLLLLSLLKMSELQQFMVLFRRRSGLR